MASGSAAAIERGDGATAATCSTVQLSTAPTLPTGCDTHDASVGDASVGESRSLQRAGTVTEWLTKLFLSRV